MIAKLDGPIYAESPAEPGRQDVLIVRSKEVADEGGRLSTSFMRPDLAMISPNQRVPLKDGKNDDICIMRPTNLLDYAIHVSYL